MAADPFPIFKSNGGTHPRPPRSIRIVQHLRTYRIVPALLALSLVLTAATPLVRYSCGMTAEEMATMPCHDGTSGHHDAPAMHDDALAMHGEMPMHGDMTDGAMPCHEVPGEEPPTPPAPCPDDSTSIHDACCSTASAPVAPMPERVELSPTALASFVVSLQPAAPSPDTHGPPAAESPPPAPVALHVLYESFLI
jgi:hypothetical protein